MIEDFPTESFLETLTIALLNTCYGEFSVPLDSMQTTRKETYFI